jgi:hypothetical protein
MEIYYPVVLPIILTVDTILSLILLLYSFDLPFFTIINVYASIERYDISNYLVLPILLLQIILIIFLFLRVKKIHVIIPLIPLPLFIIYGLKATLCISSFLSILMVILTYKNIKQYLSWTLIILNGINIFFLLHWIILIPFNIKNPLESLILIELDFYYFLTYLTPLIILLLLFSWLLKPILTWGWNLKLGKLPYTHHTFKYFNPKALLVLSILLSIISPIYPYLPSINPNNLLIGIDTENYIEWAEVVDTDLSQAFNVWGGSRPLIHIIIFFLKQISRLDSVSIVKYFTILINPLLIISLYFFTYQISQDPKLSSWTAFFAACGHQITINMYSFFLTNMMALTLTFFSLGFLFETFREQNKKSLIASSILGILLVFTHPWTLSQYFSSIALLTGVTIYQTITEKKKEHTLRPLISYLIILVIAEFLKDQILLGVGGLSATSSSFTGLEGLIGFWSHSIFSFQFLYGGLTSNIILIGLAIVGILLLNHKEIYGRYLIILTAITSIAFLLGTETIKSRLFFNLPIALFAALGFLQINERIKELTLRNLFIFFIVSAMVVNLLRSLAMIVILSAY